jgi:hypothetical protein
MGFGMISLLPVTVKTKRVTDSLTQRAMDAIISPVNSILNFLNNTFSQTTQGGTLTVVPPVILNGLTNNGNVAINGNLTVTGTYPSGGGATGYRYLLGAGSMSCYSFHSSTVTTTNMYQGSDIRTEIAFVPAFAGSLAAINVGIYGHGDGISTPPAALNFYLKKNSGAAIVPTVTLVMGTNSSLITYTKGSILFNAGDLLEVYFDSGGNPCYMLNGTGTVVYEIWVYDT